MIFTWTSTVESFDATKFEIRTPAFALTGVQGKSPYHLAWACHPQNILEGDRWR
jgi:hypothetical protein